MLVRGLDVRVGGGGACQFSGRAGRLSGGGSRLGWWLVPVPTVRRITALNRLVLTRRAGVVRIIVRWHLVVTRGGVPLIVRHDAIMSPGWRRDRGSEEFLFGDLGMGREDGVMAGPCELMVDLDALNRNVALAARLSGDRAVLVAVKADAYGHGLVAVGRNLQAAGTAQWLGVATVGEAVALRAAGITLPILKFSITLPDEMVEALAAEVVLTVGDANNIADVAAAATQAGLVADVHLKVDTGMRRIGAEPHDVMALAQQIAAEPNLRLGGIYTHLPVSDTVEGEAFTAEQFMVLRDAANDVAALCGPLEFVHAANSGAVLGHELGDTTMVRPGIMVYGSHPAAASPGGLEPVARWTSRLTFVKQVRAGETVGYGRTWTAPRDTWLGTVAVGYGDGYSRLLSNRGRMLVGGQSMPIVGRVCMDQTMIDLGPEAPSVRVGDDVVLLGRDGDQEITVAELAELMGTITYEVTCLISARVPRRHVGGVSPSSTS